MTKPTLETAAVHLQRSYPAMRAHAQQMERERDAARRGIMVRNHRLKQHRAQLAAR